MKHKPIVEPNEAASLRQTETNNESTCFYCPAPGVVEVGKHSLCSECHSIVVLIGAFAPAGLFEKPTA